MLNMFTNPALSEEDTALFLDYLKTMVRVNLPIDAGLRRLAKESASRRIRALAEMLEYTSRHCRAAIRLGNSFRQALLYPKLVIGLTVLGIIPVSLFAAASTNTIARNVENSPAITSWITWLALSITSHPLVILTFGTVVALALFHPVGPLRKVTAWIQLHLPYVGDLYRATLTASMARGLGLLIRSGVPLGEAVGKLNLDPQNPYVTESLAELTARLRDGSRFSDQLARYRIFPESFSWLVSLGETGENLDEVLLELSDFYEEEARHRGEMAARVMEPAFLLMLALVVGPVVLSVFAPIVQMVANAD